MERVFRAPTNGKYLLRALFLEAYDDDGQFVLYSLKDKDQEFNGRSIPSLKRLYIELSDPTEYDFANMYFESWDHWEALCNCVWFKPHIEKWRRELNIKLKCDSIKRIKEEAKAGKNKFQANKYLIDRGWAGEDTKGSWKMGRPSKQAIKEEAAKILEQDSRVLEDLKRMGLH